MNLFEKAEECFADFWGDYWDVKFWHRDNPSKALEALKRQRTDFESYYVAAEAAIKAAQSWVGERKV